MILVKDIIIDGNPTLRLKAQEVKFPIKRKNLKTLKDIMLYLNRSQDEKACAKYELKPGVGMAAPQIDVSLRMLGILIDENGKRYEYAIINPVVLAESVEMTYLPGGEGCLSVPGKNGIVLRHNKIKFKATFYDYKNDTLEEKILLFTGYLAIVFQHEFDHLNGILFTDKVTNDTKDIKPVEF